MNGQTPLYFLSGPTASGKTSVAHALADRMGLRLLSVDSMMVYRGMDIGTATPSPDEQKHYDYAGLNLVDPGVRFSAGDWIRAVRNQLDERPTLAVGGTGLYFKVLIHGLEENDVDVPAGLTEDVEELRNEISVLNPDALSQLADPDNPRRLQRALMWLRSGKELPQRWGASPEFPVPVLRRNTEELNQRIHARIVDMFEQGLLEECRNLLALESIGTAGQAIGYAEGLAVLSGDLTREQAVEKIATRTRRYAKRQRTWFRNQMDARWIEVDREQDVGRVTDQVQSVWQETGPFRIASENT